MMNTREEPKITVDKNTRKELIEMLSDGIRQDLFTVDNCRDMLEGRNINEDQIDMIIAHLKDRSGWWTK